MNKAELLVEIKRARQELADSIQGLEDEELERSGVMEDWSVKDILAHVARWEAELVAMLFQVQRGMQPRTAQFSSVSTDDLNAKWHAESLERTLDQVRNDWEGVHRQILRRVEEMSDQDLDDTGRFPWLHGKALSEYIAGDTYEHELDHAEDIREWRQAR